MADREHEVRQCAYYLWEAEGRPDGQAEMHWRLAEIAITLLGYLKIAENDQAQTRWLATRRLSLH